MIRKMFQGLNFRGRRNKKNYVMTIIGICVCFVTIGFAVITTALEIGGSATSVKANWNVHFANICVLDLGYTASHLQKSS